MGLFHNTKIDEEDVSKQLDSLLIPGEEVVYSLKQIRDMIVVTNYRLMVVDKQGVTGRKKMITSYLLDRVTKFEVENSPYFDIDSEFAVYFTGTADPVKFEIAKLTNVYEFSRILFEQVVKNNK